MSDQWSPETETLVARVLTDHRTYLVMLLPGWAWRCAWSRCYGSAAPAPAQGVDRQEAVELAAQHQALEVLTALSQAGVLAPVETPHVS